MVEINPTNIKGGCQSGRNNSKSDLPLMSSKQSETSESSESSVSSNLSKSSESPESSAMWKKGLARTQIPTNKNYASELPTFGVIAGVSYSVVQWSSLALGEPPWWSWLTPMPGKYALTVSRGNISQISSGWALLSKIKISGIAAGIVKILSSSKGRKQPL